MARSIRNLGFGRRNPFGVRLYLAFAFAGVALITAGIVYLLVSESGSQEADERLDELASGRTIALANEVEAVSRKKAQDTDRRRHAGGLLAPGSTTRPASSSPHRPPRGSSSMTSKTDGGRLRRRRRAKSSSSRSPAARRWSRRQFAATASIDGVMLARAARPVRAPGGDRRGPGRPDHRTFRGARRRRRDLVPHRERDHLTDQEARRLGSEDQPGPARPPARGDRRARRDLRPGPGARDDARRSRQTFEALRSERDRLSAIFDALSDAVMVVGPDGTVRFSNPAARPLIYADGKVAATLIPWLRRASRTGTSEHDGLRIGERVYAMQAREIPAEGAVLDGRPRPDRRASPRARRARVRLERGARAPQPAGRDLRRGRGSCAAARRTTRRRASTSCAGSSRTPSGSRA